MEQTPVTACERCGQPIPYGQLACPNCGALVHQRRLEQIAAEAQRLEQSDPAAAARMWREALSLLPQDSQQYAHIYHRIGALTSGWAPDGPMAAPLPQSGGAGPQPLGYESRVVQPPDPWPVAFAKTVGSMLFSIAVYYLLLFHNLPIAVGFVVLMLVHEMGHVLAMRYYGLSASPQIFIPFVGAVINLRQMPPNALVESVVGMGGPFLGTVGAMICYAWATHAGYPLRTELLVCAQLAFMLNLFNLLPVPPLDGGRITAAISPWIWIAGLIGLAALMVSMARGGDTFGLFILLLIGFYAWPRIRAVLRARGRRDPYYEVSPAASWTMAVLYVGLGILLSYMFFIKLGGWHMFTGTGLS